VLCIVADLGYAAGVVAQKPVLSEASPLAVTWLALPGGVLCLAGVALARWRSVRESASPRSYPRSMSQSDPEATR
jgi:drug/metabolite transporter (DMT)-like permease